MLPLVIAAGLAVWLLIAAGICALAGVGGVVVTFLLVAAACSALVAAWIARRIKKPETPLDQQRFC